MPEKIFSNEFSSEQMCHQRYTWISTFMDSSDSLDPKVTQAATTEEWQDFYNFFATIIFDKQSMIFKTQRVATFWFHF